MCLSDAFGRGGRRELPGELKLAFFSEYVPLVGTWEKGAGVKGQVSSAICYAMTRTGSTMTSTGSAICYAVFA